MKKNKLKIIIPLILIGVIFILGAAYAWLVWTSNGDQKLKIKGGSLELAFADSTNQTIYRELDIPKSDAQGYQTDSYSFSVINSGSVAVGYELYLDDLDLDTGDVRISDSDLKYVLLKNGEPFYDTVVIKFVEGNYTGYYDVATNKFTSVKNGSGSEMDSLKDALNNSISGSGSTDSDGAVQAFKNVLSPNLTYEVTKTNKSKLLSTATNRKIYSGYINSNSTDTFELKVWIQSEAVVNDVSDKVFKAKVRLNGTQVDSVPSTYIKTVYKYNQDSTSSDYCLGGEEATCKEIYAPSTYPVGTIVKYEVAPGVEKYFNVLYDNGNTLTMIQRENIPSSTSDSFYWASTDDNTQGPITAIDALINATQNWSNVNDQTYTLGTTEFGSKQNKSSYTGCAHTYPSDGVYGIECSSNVYTMSSITAKARMIAVQEALEFGCNGVEEQSCNKKFLTNYLNDSTNYGGSVNANPYISSNDGYWTMNAYDSVLGKSYSNNFASSSANYAYYILRSGQLDIKAVGPSGGNGRGIRPVVVVNK